MAWGDLAKQAFDKALETYEKLAKLSATVEQLWAAFVDFRDELRKRIGDLESRTQARVDAVEEREDRKVASLETRMRDLESRMAQIEGKVTSALAEAYKLAITDAKSRGTLPSPSRRE